VHLCDVDDAALGKLAIKATWTRADVANRDDVDRLFREAVQSLGGLDVLVNNAGIAGPTGRVDEIDPKDWDRCIAIDLTGLFNCTRLAVPLLKSSRNPSIINLSSVAGRLAFPLRTPYAAAKWGVVGFTKSLAAELGEYGIRVNAIQPGLVEGARIRSVIENKARALNKSYEEVEQSALSKVSLRTMVTPTQLADQILFLCSPRGRTISGQAISICGDTQALM
jgi:NAD(P)-dependent dehydrogenase (short-subunit alcohol dehydrogenase family)